MTAFPVSVTGGDDYLTRPFEFRELLARQGLPSPISTSFVTNRNNHWNYTKSFTGRLPSRVNRLSLNGLYRIFLCT